MDMAVRLYVDAHPGARADRVEWLADERLGVWVRARPVDGQANAAIERAIAVVTGLRARQVKIVGGATNRRKIVEVDLPDMVALRERLAVYRLRSP